MRSTAAFVLFGDVYARREQVQKQALRARDWEQSRSRSRFASPDPSRVPHRPPRGAPDTFETKNREPADTADAAAVRAIGLPIGSVDVITDRA